MRVGTVPESLKPLSVGVPTGSGIKLSRQSARYNPQLSRDLPAESGNRPGTRSQKSWAFASVREIGHTVHVTKNKFFGAFAEGEQGPGLADPMWGRACLAYS